QSAAIAPLPVVNSESNLQWFECGVCGHMPTRGRTDSAEEQRVEQRPSRSNRLSSPQTFQPTAGPVVLVIDDVHATRSGLVQLLRLRGFDAREACNGVEGLDVLRREPGVRVVVLDLLMPGTNGYWFREQQLKDPKLASIPVIVFTGASEDQIRATLSNVDVLRK